MNAAEFLDMSEVLPHLYIDILPNIVTNERDKI